QNRLFEYVEPADGASPGTWKPFPLALKPDQSIHTMINDSSGTLWVGTSRGLVRYRDGKQALYTTAQGLSHNDILALYEDRDRNLWVGTAGVCKLSGDMLVTFTRTEGLATDAYKIIEDRQGRIYVSTEDRGLAEIIGDKVVPVAGSQSPPF